MRLKPPLLVIAALAACSSSEPPRSLSDRCGALRDHVIDLRLKDAPNVDIEAHRAVMKQAIGAQFVAECVKGVSEKQLSCSLAATDSESVAACSASK